VTYVITICHGAICHGDTSLDMSFWYVMVNIYVMVICHGAIYHDISPWHIIYIMTMYMSWQHPPWHITMTYIYHGDTSW